MPMSIATRLRPACQLLVMLAFAMILAVTAPAGRASEPDEATTEQAIAVEAYFYLYPLVVMEYTRRQLSNVPAGTQGLGAPTNAFGASRSFPTPEMHSVPRPNFDTLYSPAWVDLSQGPVLMSTPDTGARYQVITLLDMWSEMFASTGTRTTGNGAGHFLITPPGWSGTRPADLPQGTIDIPAPTGVVWIIGRLQTNGTEDFPAVHALQDKFLLTAYDDAGNPLPPQAFTPDAQRRHEDPAQPSGRGDRPRHVLRDRRRPDEAAPAARRRLAVRAENVTDRTGGGQRL